MKLIRTYRPSPALVISCLALFVAMAGTAVALEADSIRSKHIKDDTIQSEDVATGTLDATDLRNQSVSTAEITEDSVLDWHLRESSVRAEEILAGSVRSSELSTVQVRYGEATAITDGDGGNNDWSGGEATASCEENEQILSGFGLWDDASGGNDTAIAEQSINTVTRVHFVTVRGIQNTGSTKALRAAAVCLGV